MTIVGIIKWLTFGFRCGPCQTCFLGDGDSCNTNDEFDNMNSVKMITGVMFKSHYKLSGRHFYHDTYKSNGLL